MKQIITSIFSLRTVPFILSAAATCDITETEKTRALKTATDITMAIDLL
jgi:hypothetical protein